jgi:hypothetical protein
VNRLRLASFALVGALAGCSDDEPDFVPASLPECPSHDYHTCDTRKVSCQKRLLELTACVYGTEVIPSIPVQLISEREFRDILEAELADEEAMQTEDDIAATELLESALTDLRLSEAGGLSGEVIIDDYVENLAGVYLDPENGVVLIDHGSPQNDPEANALLVHELVHALQDADYDLDTWAEPYATSTDSILALRSVTEGQATYYGFRVGLAMLGYATEGVDYEQTLLNLTSDLDAATRDDASPYTRSGSTFPYGYGGLAAYKAWVEGGQGYESALIESPPASTQEVLHAVFPDDTPEVERVELSAPAETGDYALLDEDVLGGWLLGVMLTKHGLDISTAESLSGTWSGDHLWLYRDSADGRGWLWELQLTSETAAAEVMGALTGELPDAAHLEHSGARLFIASGSDGPPQELLDAGSAFLAGE